MSLLFDFLLRIGDPLVLAHSHVSPDARLAVELWRFEASDVERALSCLQKLVISASSAKGKYVGISAPAGVENQLGDGDLVGQLGDTKEDKPTAKEKDSEVGDECGVCLEHWEVCIQTFVPQF
jgi:hypothetical protein